MGDSMLTIKELTLVSDLMTIEENACKKARLYARILTDVKLAEKMNQIADHHEKRFNNLYALL